MVGGGPAPPQRWGPSPLRSTPMSTRPPSRRALVALSLLGCACLGAVGCSGDGGGSAATSTSTSTAPAELTYEAYSDPTALVQVDVRRRFAIMLPADPAKGWRWVVEPVDTNVLAPLGSEFREDPALLAQATTTTAPPPPELPSLEELAELLAPGEDGPDGTAPGSTTTTAPPVTEPPETTTTTAPGPQVQIVSYAGRALGVASVTLRYERIGTADTPDEPARTVVFDVVVGEIFSPPDEPPPEETTPGDDAPGS